jgi:hypothetical protein
MVGDYISTSILTNGMAFPAFALASAPQGSVFNEETYTIRNGLPVTGGTIASTARVVAAGHSPVTMHLSDS